MGGYDDAYGEWRRDPEGFWRAASTAIEWDRGPEAIIDRSQKPKPRSSRWSAQHLLNAVDRHVRDGRGEQMALVYDSPVTNTVRSYTYRELRDEVARVAGRAGT